MSLKKYITESERAHQLPVTGDVIQAIVNEEIALEFDVVGHSDDGFVIESDGYGLRVLEACNYVDDDTDGEIDPKTEDHMHNTKVCKDCGDEIYKPTTDCGYDSQDPDGENWVMIDVDGDGDADVAISNEGYRSITTEGTLMERIKDGKIYCPEACCGVKVMDCTCGAKCPHCNCKQIQKLSESIDNWKEQELLHTRMGNPDTAGYYTKKLNEAVATTQSLVEDVEDVEAMITRRIMNHPEFSDMVREYGIEQITQAITDTAEFHGDDQDEIGSSDISAMVNDTIKSLRRMIEGDGPDEEQQDRTKAKKMDEAEYQGREVKLGKPMQGDVKKFKVYVKDPKTGNTKKVNFGDPNMEIRRDNPAAKKSFRARHNCSDKKDRTKAGYWSCRMWSSKPVSKIV
tara:strand:- start:56 stop:1255 length:1200 start_codon:yes stop_codon:yes gene_type:complete